MFNFIKRGDKIYDYEHKSGKISLGDLNKESCTCNEMFDKGMCPYLVKLSLLENYLLPVIKKKQSL